MNVFCSRLCDGNFYANFELTFILFYFIHIYIALPEWIFLKRTWEKKFPSSSFFSYEFLNVNLLWFQQPPEKSYQELQHIQKYIFFFAFIRDILHQGKTRKTLIIFTFIAKIIFIKICARTCSLHDTNVWTVNFFCHSFSKVSFYSFILRVHYRHNKICMMMK